MRCGIDPFSSDIEIFFHEKNIRNGFRLSLANCCKMCEILLQIHEVFMFYFCELYHEIIKQDILSKRGGPQNGHQDLYISSHQPTRGSFSVC